MSTVHEVFASRNEQEVTALVREVDEPRRASGLRQLGPWWQVQRAGLFGPRWLGPNSTPGTMRRRWDRDRHPGGNHAPPRPARPVDAEVPFGAVWSGWIDAVRYIHLCSVEHRVVGLPFRRGLFVGC